MRDSSKATTMGHATMLSMGTQMPCPSGYDPSSTPVQVQPFQNTIRTCKASAGPSDSRAKQPRKEGGGAVALEVMVDWRWWRKRLGFRASVVRRTVVVHPLPLAHIRLCRPDRFARQTDKTPRCLGSFKLRVNQPLVCFGQLFCQLGSREPKNSCSDCSVCI